MDSTLPATLLWSDDAHEVLARMSYRDDREADQARIAALEAELAAAKRRVDELETRHSLALVRTSSGALAETGKARSAAAKWLGAPVRLALERTFDAAYPVDKLEDLLDVIQRVTGDRGRTELLRSSLTWWASTAMQQGGAPMTSITISVKDGRTTLSASDRLGPVAGGIFAGIGIGVGAGGSIAPIFASIAVPILTPVFILGWFGGIYGGTRTIYKRVAKKRAQRLDALLEAVAAEIERALKT